MVWACDEKIRALLRRAMEMDVQGRRMRGRPKIGLLDSVRDDIREKGLSGEKGTTEPHGGIFSHT